MRPTSKPKPALITPPETPESDTTGSRSPARTFEVSRTFHPESSVEGMRHTDLVLVSSDSVPVLFYAHSRILQGVSKNSFARLLPACESTDLELDLPSVKVALDARVLNVVLHALYGFSSAHYAPEFSTLCTAVDALLTTYAVHQTLVLQQTSPLFALLMAHAPLQPLNVYALAAKHDIEPLAVASSSFLLSYPIDSITDDDARRMGPVYLRRLFFLHLGRVAALKRLLAPLPERHAPTPDCDTPDQDKVKRAWILATAFLIYDARADTTPLSLQATLNPLLSALWCKACRDALTARIHALVGEWSAVKTTI